MTQLDAGDLAQVPYDSGQIEQLLDFYGFLIQANSLVARADDIGKLYEDICRLGVLLDRRLVLAWVGMMEPGRDELRVVAHAGPASDYLKELRVNISAEDAVGRGPTGRALREGRCVIVNRFADDPSTAPWQERARGVGIACAAAVPLRRDGAVCGGLMLYGNTIDVFDARIASELEVLSQTLSHAIDAAGERAARRALDAHLLESQRAMRAILDAGHQTILMMRPEGEMLAINRMGAERLGMSPQEAIGQNLFDALAPQVVHRWRAKIAEVLQHAAPTTFEDRNRGRLFRSTVYPVLDGAPCVVVYAEDITERRLEEERSRRQAERWLALLRLAQTGEYEGAHGEHDFLSRALEEAQRLTGSRIGFLHLVNEDQLTCELVAWTGAALSEAGRISESHYPIGRAGIWVSSFRERRGLIVNDYAAPVRSDRSDEEGAALHRLITVPVIDADKVRVIAWVGDKAEPYDQDDLEFLQILAADAWRIIRRRRAESDLREALQVVEASPVVCFRRRAEPDRPVDYVSQNVARWGWSARDLVAGQPPIKELVHPDDLPRLMGDERRYDASGIDEYVQRYRLRHAQGHWFWVEERTRVIRNGAGLVAAYEGVVSDIDANVHYEQSLAESLDAQRALNKKLESAQNQLLQSEKLASIGQLAAGVAHEINNPIGFVSSNLGTLGSYLRDIFALIDVCDAAAAASARPEEFAPYRAARAEREIDYLRDDSTELLAESKEGLERVRKIVQDLKDFSRVGEVHWQWADLHQGIDSTLNIVWNELKYNCTVAKRYGALPLVYCVVPQLNQVFMNLLVNAAQAIETKGEIVITTECVGETAVRISICDNGRGIAPEHLNRLFEPFFTTKPVGKGTGLGLSLAWGIIERHQGRIEVASEPGKGSTFTITLPVRPAVGEFEAHTP